MSNIDDNIQSLKKVMAEQGIVPENGLGKELFLFASTLMPVVNIDLFVINEKNQVLLSWRDDGHCGQGWHIPGGCVRFRETFAERIQSTAKDELGSEVEFDEKPIEVFEIFSKENSEGLIDQRERAHFITIVFKCRVPDDYEIDNHNFAEHQAGFLKGFDTIPDDLLEVQKCYRKLLGKLLYI